MPDALEKTSGMKERIEISKKIQSSSQKSRESLKGLTKTAPFEASSSAFRKSDQSQLANGASEWRLNGDSNH